MDVAEMMVLGMFDSDSDGDPDEKMPIGPIIVILITIFVIAYLIFSHE